MTKQSNIAAAVLILLIFITFACFEHYQKPPAQPVVEVKASPKEIPTHKKTHKKKKPQPENIYPLEITSGNIKMFLTDFTRTLKPDKNCSSPVCHEVLGLIDHAESTIDMALFGWTEILAINNAVTKAIERGVVVRLVYDDADVEYYEGTPNQAKLVSEAVSDNDSKTLMHNKFLIFDNKIVLTGSMNFSDTGLSGFNTNNIFVINSPEIAQIYTDEFNQMFSGKFHEAKTSGGRGMVYFSPQDKVIEKHIIPMINDAKNYIYLPIFLITRADMTDALISAKQRGVNVKVIVDAVNPDSKASQIPKLRAAGVPVKTENYAGKMHAKTLIIDDRYIIAGSMNFSKTGENKNDENVLIIDNPVLARHYKGFFEYLWAKIPDRYLKHNVRAESIYSIGSCTDGIDNNFDKKIDNEDVGCQQK